MKRLLLCSVAFGVLHAAGPALADCAPDSIGSGEIATCTGIDNDGFSDGSSDITVNVLAGAVVNSAVGDDAIDIDDDDTTLNNAGVLNGDDDGVQGGDGFTLVNNGTINAGDDGVNVEGRSNVHIVNNGTIASGDRGVHMDDDAGGGLNNVLVNTGSIVSTGGEGIEGGDNNTITNAAGALIQGYDDALQVGENATITNHGTIRSNGIPGDPQDGIDIDSGTILNGATGRILSDLDAAIDFDESTIASTIDNAGEIAGETGIMVETNPAEANTAAQSVINRTGATIEGRAGIALLLGAGMDSLTNEAGGTILGSALFGDDDDRMTLVGSYSGHFGGAGAVFDGGTGTDTFDFVDYAFGQITGVSLITDGFALSLDNGSGMFDIALTGWESFIFAGDLRDAGDLRGLALAAVPLPAGMVLLLSGIGGLAALRRRRGARTV